MGDRSPVDVASFLHPFEADLARARLEAEGIVARVADARTVLLNPLQGLVFGGVRVLVASEDAPEARALLAEVKEERQEEARACPDCGSPRIAARRLFVRLAWVTLATIGFPVGRAKPQWRCSDCGRAWRE
ncbi:MAG: putative signal transducing protein [Planctomycetaceae bacterium]